MKLRLIAAALAAGSVSLSVQADTSPSSIDEVIVISSRQPVPLRQVGTSVSRLDETEISERGYFGVADLLRTLPSIAVSNSGGLGQRTSLNIRGEEGYRTLVLIDGMDVSDHTSPRVAPRIEHLPSAGLASIEVLRGPQGMMYGADAGGVLSLRTGVPEPGLQSGIRLDTGRYGTQRYAVNLGGKGEQGDFYLSGSRLETEGFNARTEDQVLADDDGYENTSFHGRVGWQLNDSLRLQAVVRDVQSDTEYDGCYSAAFDLTHHCRGEFDQRSYRTSLEYSGGRLQQSLAVQHTSTDSADYAEGELSFSSRGETQRLEYQAVAKLTQTTDLLFGLDRKREEMETDSGELARRQIGYFTEVQSNPVEPLFITLGLRHDDHDDFGRHSSYRFSTAYLIPVGSNKVLKLKASAGTGFRAPSLYEVANTAPGFVGELREEKSKGYDFGVEFYLGTQSQMELVFFDQEVKDEIDWIGGGYRQVPGGSESSGVELSARHRFSELWSIAANMTFNDTETRVGESRLQRPRQMANITVSVHPLSDLAVHLNWRAARKARAYDYADPSGLPLDNYQVVDISARYRPFEILSLYGRIENLTDEKYQEVLGYNTSGRAGYLGFELKL